MTYRHLEKGHSMPSTPSSKFRKILTHGGVMALMVLTLAACADEADTSGSNDDEQTCTTIIIPSVMVTVVDDLGSPTTADEVTWSVDGGESQPAECDNDGCTEWRAGEDAAGEVTVTATLNDQTISDTVTVPMAADGCHVVTQALTLQFPAPDDEELICTQSIEPSVIVTTLDSEGEPVVADAVSWSVDGGQKQAAECWYDPCTVLHAAWETPGEITVTATLGDLIVTDTVTVTADECHVQTQELTLQFPAPDDEEMNCTEDIVPSVIVTTLDSDGEPVVAKSVEWSVHGADPQPADCWYDPCTVLHAGWEVAGDITVTAYLGNEMVSDTVTVPADECHVITQALQLQFPPIGDGSEILCTQEVLPSVIIITLNSAGQPVAADSIVWSVNGGTEQDAECLNAGCTEQVAGWEASGEFIITATLGDEVLTETLTVTADECHVHTHQLTLQFQSTGDDVMCTEETIPSVAVTTLDAAGVPVVADSVTWSVDGGEEQASECWVEPCTMVYAGMEVSGDITVTATLGTEVLTDTVTVTADECHVITQTMTLQFTSG
jgi:hypothetical protein